LYQKLALGKMPAFSERNVKCLWQHTRAMDAPIVSSDRK
jgi:hypothetical protein